MRAFRHICYKLWNTINMTCVICISGIAAVILSFIMLSNFSKVHVSEELCNANYAIRANNIENGIEYNNGISGYISHDYKSDFCTVLNVDNDSSIQIILTDEQNAIFDKVRSLDNPLYLEAKIIDGNRVEITKVHNIYDSDTIYYKLMMARRVLVAIIIFSFVTLVFVKEKQ